MPKSKTAKKTPKAKAPKAEKATKPAKPARPASALDLAARVLKDAEAPMRVADIAAAVIAAGWATKGKTPGATLNAAIIREIRDKGVDSRFKKTDRGLFAAA